MSLPLHLLQASVWEHKASLTDTQQRAIEVISLTCAQRPLPHHISGETASSVEPAQPARLSRQSTHDGLVSPRADSVAVELSFAGTSFEDVVLQSNSEFYRWLTELEAARATETESKYQRHAAVLDRHLAECDDLLATIGEISSLFDALKEGQHAVSGRTAPLHVTCERLVAEREALAQAVDALGSKLAHFDELDKVAAQFHTTSLSLDDADILASLQKLDESLSFLSSHPHYADAATFSTKFRQIQSRALAAVRTKVQHSFKEASSSVQRATGATGPTTSQQTTASDGAAELTLLCVRFRAAAEPSLKELLKGIESRVDSSPEYARLMRDCQALFCETRLGLMRGPVAAHLAAQANQPLPSMVRAGSEFLLHVAQLESGLFEALFPGSAAKGGTATALAPLMDPLCTLLYDALRPALVSLRDVYELCELGFVLQEESLAGSSAARGGRGTAAALLGPILGRTLGDVQERLAYRAMAYIRESISGFVPRFTDLDFPAALQQTEGEVGGGGGLEDGETDGLNDKKENEQQNEPQYVGWYPPVQRAVTLLSNLYRIVPSKAFSGLAQEAIAAAVAATQDAARAVTKSAGPLHGRLFAARQLLLLREGIAPLEADFAVVERDLDFSHLRDYLRQTLTGQLPIFTFSSSNAVVQLVSRGPWLSESQLDAKRDLERALKTACETIIMGITKSTVDPALTFLTKVTSVRAVAVQGGNPANSIAEATTSEDKPLREHAFAAPERVADVVSAVNAALEGPFRQAVSELKLYLPSAGTQTALLRPIKENVAEAHSQLEALIDAEYQAQDKDQIGLMPKERLDALLESL